MSGCHVVFYEAQLYERELYYLLYAFILQLFTSETRSDTLEWR